MKIKYNLEYNYLSIYDEVQGIITNKQFIYRNDYRPIAAYTKEGFKFIKVAIVELILLIIFKILPLPLLFPKALTFIFALTVGAIVTYYITFFSLYSTEKNRRHKGELLIDEKGLLDTSEDGTCIGIPWHFIECVIITDTIILFISKSISSLVITADHYDEVITAINKYQSDLKILDKRYKRNLPKIEQKEEIKEEEQKKQEKKTTTKKKKTDVIDKSIEDVENAIKDLTKEE